MCHDVYDRARIWRRVSIFSLFRSVYFVFHSDLKYLDLGLLGARFLGLGTQLF